MEKGDKIFFQKKIIYLDYVERENKIKNGGVIKWEAMNVKKLIPSILLLLEGLTFLGGYRIKGIAHFMFGTWGMYVQSSLYDGVYGFSIMMVLAAEVLIIAVCYLLGRYILQGKEMEGV